MMNAVASRLFALQRSICFLLKPNAQRIRSLRLSAALLLGSAAALVVNLPPLDPRRIESFECLAIVNALSYHYS